MMQRLFNYKIPIKILFACLLLMYLFMQFIHQPASTAYFVGFDIKSSIQMDGNSIIGEYIMNCRNLKIIIVTQ